MFLKSVGWKGLNKKRFIIFERLLNILKAFLCLLAKINSLYMKRTEPCTLIVYSRSLVLISLEQFIHFPSNRNLTTKDVFSGKQSIILRQKIAQLSIMLPSMEKVCLLFCAANNKSCIFISKIAIPSNRFHRGPQISNFGGKLPIFKVANVRRMSLEQLREMFVFLVFFWKSF